MKKPKTEMVEIGRGTYIEKKKLLVKGEDWHGYAFRKYKTGKFLSCNITNPLPWYPGIETSKTGKWVKVKFVEAE